MSPRARRAAWVACALAALALVAGCGRRSRVEYHGSDSLARAQLDSAAIAVRTAQQAWDAPGGGPEAARLTAGALARALGGTPPDRWEGRAREFLDSLGVGAEIAAAECAVAVNLFSRADPAAGSWPWLFWCGAKGAEAQAVEGRTMRLQQLVSRGLPARPAKPDTPTPLVAALFDRRGALGPEPFVMVWSLRGGRWDIVQTLGPDSLGGAGSGDFEPADDGALLVARTYRTSRGFDECATCPHAYRVHRFAWGPTGFTRLDQTEVASPYTTFVRFVQALAADDLFTAEMLVTDRYLAEAARRADFGTARGLWRVAPATDETATSMVFLRGATEAYRVGFVLRGGEWRIDAIQVTERGVE
jgi:hypothetical protein